MQSSKNAISSHVYLKVFHLESEEIQNNMFYLAEEIIPFFLLSTFSFLQWPIRSMEKC